MTDQFYYNCLVPGAAVPKEGEDVADTPPPRPPRLQRSNENVSSQRLDPPRPDSVDIGHEGPEVPPRSAAFTTPVHYRTCSEPVRLGFDEPAWSPQFLQDTSQKSYSETSSRAPPAVRSPPWLQDNNRVPGDTPVGPPLRSPSMDRFAFEYNTNCVKDPANSINNLSPRWQEAERSPSYDKSSSNTGSAEPSPGLPHRSTRSNPGSAEPSPGLLQRTPSSNPGSAEPSPGLPHRKSRRHTIETTPSYEYPPSSPRKHEFHQVSK